MTAPAAPAPIRPLQEADLPAAAAFLQASAELMPQAGAAERRLNQAPEILRRLRWRLLQNPDRLPEAGLGDCLWDENGAVAGVHLVHPQRMRLAGQILPSLCSGSFFVAPSQRMQGYFLFRRFLKLRAPAHFATTCNADSGALWQKLGGVPVADSDAEVLVPIRMGPLAAEAMLRRNLPVFAGPAALAAGVVGALTGRRRRATGLVLEPCTDWERLAAVAAQHTDPEQFTAERSAAWLQWRLAAGPARDQIEVLWCRDAAGHAGYVATLRGERGRREQIRTRTLLDWVLPPTGIAWRDLLDALVERYRGDTDLISLPGALQHWLEPGTRRTLVRRFPAPQAYVCGKDAGGRPLAERAVFTNADGDSSR